MVKFYLTVYIASYLYILVSQCSLTWSLGHLLLRCTYDATKMWPSDKVKEYCETNLKVHCVM